MSEVEAEPTMDDASAPDAVAEAKAETAAGHSIDPTLADRLLAEIERLRAARQKRWADTAAPDVPPDPQQALRDEASSLRLEVARLKAENEKLLERLRSQTH